MFVRMTFPTRHWDGDPSWGGVCRDNILLSIPVFVVAFAQVIWGNGAQKNKVRVYLFSCRNILNPAQLPACQVFGGNVPLAQFWHSHTGKRQVSFVPQACELCREHFFVRYKWYFLFCGALPPSLSASHLQESYLLNLQAVPALSWLLPE